MSVELPAGQYRPGNAPPLGAFVYARLSMLNEPVM